MSEGGSGSLPGGDKGLGPGTLIKPLPSYRRTLIPGIAPCPDQRGRCDAATAAAMGRLHPH